jgi:hypothetical protein
VTNFDRIASDTNTAEGENHGWPTERLDEDQQRAKLAGRGTSYDGLTQHQKPGVSEAVGITFLHADNL